MRNFRTEAITPMQTITTPGLYMAPALQRSLSLQQYASKLEASTLHSSVSIQLLCISDESPTVNFYNKVRIISFVIIGARPYQAKDKIKDQINFSFSLPHSLGMNYVDGAFFTKLFQTILTLTNSEPFIFENMLRLNCCLYTSFFF